MDFKSLQELLLSTPEIVRHHRSRVIKAPSFSFQDEHVSTGNKLGSIPPLSLSAMEIADMEAAAVLNLIYFAATYSSFPAIRMSGAYRVNGEIRGILGDHAIPWLEQVCTIAAQHADKVLSIPGHEDYVEDIEKIRGVSYRLFPYLSQAKYGTSIDEEWISLSQAIKDTAFTKIQILNMLRDHKIPTSIYEGQEMLISRQPFMQVVVRKSIQRTKQK